MKNKWFLVTVAVVLWGVITNGLFTPHGGMVSRFIHRSLGRVLPPDIFGVPSLTIVLIIFTIIFARFAYLFIFTDKDESSNK